MAPPKITRSKVWQVFRRLPGHAKVKCDFCQEMFSVKQNTSSALRHLRRKHVEEYHELFGSNADTKNAQTESAERVKSPPRPPQQQFWLRWNRQADILGSLGGLLDNESFVDVTLFAEGRTLKAHKIILSSCSPYFETMFHSINSPNPVIFLRDVRYDIMKAILSFVYRGEVFIEYSSLPELVKTAEALKIIGLADISWNNSVPVNIVQVEQKSHSPGQYKVTKPESSRHVSSQKFEFIEPHEEMESADEEMEQSAMDEVIISEQPSETETFEEEPDDLPVISAPTIKIHPKHLQQRPSLPSEKIEKVSTISRTTKEESRETLMIYGMTPEGELAADQTAHVFQHHPGDEWREGNQILEEGGNVEIHTDVSGHADC